MKAVNDVILPKAGSPSSCDWSTLVCTIS